MAKQQSENSNEATCPYWQGDRVMHVDGRIGLITGVPTKTPETATVFAVRMTGEREIWKAADLTSTEKRPDNRLVHTDGRTGFVLADLAKDTFMVRVDTEHGQIWELDEIAGLADEVIRTRTGREYQAEIDRLKESLDELETEKEQVESDLEKIVTTSTASPTAAEKVEVKVVTSVRRLPSHLNQDVTYDDPQIARFIADEWEILDITESTAVCDEQLLTVRSVTLRKDRTDDPAPQNGERASVGVAVPVAVEITDILDSDEPVVDDPVPAKVSEPTSKVFKPSFVEVDPDAIDNILQKEGLPNLTFEQALRGGYDWQTVATIGDRQAYERAKAVFCGKRAPVVSRLPGLPPAVGAGVRVQI